MKRIFFILILLATCGLGVAFSQLKVSNGFGQTLIVTINGQTRQIPNNGVQTFSVNSRTVWLECRTLDSKISFSASKEVSRGLVLIEPKDNNTKTPVQKSPNTANPQNYKGERIAFVYEGIDRFKIFSEIGRGLEFIGADSLNPADNAKNRYYIYAPKNQDLVIGVGIKEGENQAIWPYAEIRKRINSWDTVCYIAQNDIKKMSASEKKNLKIRLIAENYKIFFEPDAKDPISLGFRGVSRSVEVPIGQFYIRISYTDPNGMFHSTVFVPKHVTGSDRSIDITKNDLDNAVQLNW